MSIEAIAPQALATMLALGEVLLIDVREKNEYAAERIADARLCPLSGFDAANLPDPADKTVVFYCAGGVRSAKAVAACAAAGLPYHLHLAGGISAWKAAGLPVER